MARNRAPDLRLVGGDIDAAESQIVGIPPLIGSKQAPEFSLVNGCFEPAESLPLLHGKLYFGVSRKLCHRPRDRDLHLTHRLLYGGPDLCPGNTNSPEEIQL